MNALFYWVGLLFLAVSAISTFLLLYEAYQEEPWKAVLGFFIPLYLLYWAIVEFDDPRKWLLTGLSFGGSIIGLVVLNLGR
jgi:hypothetical protein